MKQYFTEFEFQKETDNYWFPVLINAKNEEKAELVKKKIAEILEKEFKVIRSYPLEQYDKPVYSEALRPYVEKQSRAEVIKLNLRKLQLVNFEKDMDITFTQHIAIVPQNLRMIYSHRIEYHLDYFSLLTTQFHDELDYEKEFLVLRIY